MKSFLLRLRIVVLLGAAATLLFTSGCLVVAAGAAGAGAVAYVRGELDATLGNTFDAVTRATDRAIQDLKFAKVSDRKDALAAQFVARTALDKRVVITLDKTSESATRVRIRVGFIGDEQISRSLLERIKANL